MRITSPTTFATPDTAETSLDESLAEAGRRCVTAGDEAALAQARYRRALADYDRLVAENQRRRLAPYPERAR